MSTHRLFPLFLKLGDRRVLVVGGTALLEGKIEALLNAGAQVWLVASEVTPAIAKLVRFGKIHWEQREFLVTDLESVALVLASDANQEVNQLAYKEALSRNIPCNVVDQPELCSFYYPAVVRRGQLQIAISTGGLSPSLASRLREELEQRLDPDYEAWVDALGKARERILKTHAASRRRNALLKRIASRRAFEQFRTHLRAQGGVA